MSEVENKTYDQDFGWEKSKENLAAMKAWFKRAAGKEDYLQSTEFRQARYAFKHRIQKVKD